MHHLAKGQALPMGLAFIAVLSFLAIMLFNTSQVSGERMRVSNAADAAAYSGLVWQARTLNFQAYTNRAMVANQVAIAQVVSITNWSRYLTMASANIDFYGTLIPPAKPYTSAMLSAAHSIETAVTNFASMAVPVMDVLLEVLSMSQQVMHYAAAATTSSVVYKVVKENDPNYELTPLGYAWLADNALKWDDFTHRYDDEDALLRKASLINNDSRDKFTRERDWQWTTLNLGLFKAQLVKRGTTRLQYHDDEWQWKARDTMSIHIREWRCRASWSGVKCGWDHTEIPIGWAQSTLSTTGDDIDPCKWCAWSKNRNAEALAHKMNQPVPAMYGGVRDYRDMKELDASKPEGKDPRLYLAIEVAYGAEHVRTSSNIDGIGSPNPPAPSRNGLGSGMFHMDEDFADPLSGGGSEMSAIGKAEVYFRRPIARANGQYGATDNKDEFGNLFNPYWEVRLADATQERKIAWANKKVIFPEGVNPGGVVPND